jgi:hypothetical protein
MRKIILIGGGIGVGKSYLSDIFVKNGFIKESFAHTLKAFCFDLMKDFFVNFTQENIYGDLHFKNKPLIQTTEISFLNSVNFLEVWLESLKTQLDSKTKARIKYKITKILTKRNVTSREIMQVIGTDVFRNIIDKDFNVDTLINRLDDTSEDIVIDDYRFLNYYTSLKSKKKYDVFSVGLIKNNLPKSKHSSENQELIFDMTINLEYDELITTKHYNMIMEEINGRR